MKIFLLSVTVVSSLLMVGVILLQQGKGAGLGSSFGGGARGGLYETAGKANFLTRATSILATIFLASSLGLSLYLGREAGVLEELRRPSAESAAEIAPSAETERDAAEEIPE
ncbi:MAG: preprotein translocase subunit SecG [Gammaproteobacteria bacterium]